MQYMHFLIHTSVIFFKNVAHLHGRPCPPPSAWCSQAPAACAASARCTRHTAHAVLPPPAINQSLSFRRGLRCEQKLKVHAPSSFGDTAETEKRCCKHRTGTTPFTARLRLHSFQKDSQSPRLGMCCSLCCRRRGADTDCSSTETRL